MRSALLALGVILLVIGGLVAAGVFKYESRENVIDLGPIQVDRTETHRAPLNLGWILLGAGTVAVVVGLMTKKK